MLPTNGNVSKTEYAKCKMISKVSTPVGPTVASAPVVINTALWTLTIPHMVTPTTSPWLLKKIALSDRPSPLNLYTPQRAPTTGN
jgi:hypothetical protein